MHKKKAPHANSGVASNARAGSKYRGTGSNAVSTAPQKSSASAPTKMSPTPLMESTKGVYANKALHYANSAVLGSPMVVETVEGHKFEGIFTSWSPELEMVLEKCHKIEAHDTPGHINPKHVTQKLVFKLSTIVRSYCINVDLEFASKSGGESGFLTDTQISNANGELNMRELEEWVPDADDDCDGLDLNSSSGKGWNAEEMFAINEQRHGVTTTYKDTLEGYTYQIKDSESLEFREREARADSIAREIQGNMASHRQVELENGDEEAMFSAVDRSQSKDRTKKDHSPQSARDQSGGQSKYVPPARRQNSLNKGSHSSGPLSGGGGRHYQQGHMHSTPPPNQNSSQHHSGREYHAHRDRDHHGHGGHDEFGRGGHGSGSGPSPHQGNGSRQSYDRRPGNNSYSGNTNSPHSGTNSSVVNNNNSTSNTTSNANFHGSNSNNNNNIRESSVKGSPQSSGSANPSRLDSKESSKETGNRSPHASAGVPRGPPPNFAPAPASTGKSQAEHVSELKDFHSNFKMAGQHNLPPPQGVAAQSQTSQPPPVNAPPAASAVARTSSPMGVSASGGGSEQQNSQKDIPPYAPPNAVDNNSPGIAKGQALKPEPTNNEGVEVVKKSTLNPNAKEFNFNPNAKSFVPSGPSGGRPSGATPPARPQTPGTPSGHQIVSMAPVAYPQNFAQNMMGPSPSFSLGGAFNHGSSHAGTLYTSVPPTAVPANMAMPTHTVVPQPHQMHQHPQSQGQRFRGNNGPPPPRGSMGGEGPSPMHVSGQPLLASGLLGNIQAQGHQPPTSFMQFQHGNPTPMHFTTASLANQQQQHHQQQIAHLRFTNAHGGMVPTSIAPFLTQPHALNVAPPPGSGSQDGPQSLPQWQGGVPSSQQPNMPPSLPQGSMTPTPSQAGGGGGNTTPSPGPHHHPHHPHHHPLHHHPQQQQHHQHQQHQQHQMMFNIAAAPGGQPQSLPPHFMSSNIVMNYPVHPQMTQPHNMPPQQAMGVPVSGVAQHYMPQGIHSQQFMMAPTPGGPPPVNGVQPTQ